MRKGELGEFQIYFRKILLHEQSFDGFDSFRFALVAEKFEKMSKMKLLSLFSWQHFSPSNNASSDFLYPLHDDVN